MKKYIGLLTLCLVLVIVPFTKCFSAVVTLSEGKLVNTEGVNYSDNILNVKNGTDSINIPRSGIKDISFSARKQEKPEKFSTDSSDLKPLMIKAKAMLKKYPDSNSILVLDEGNYQHKKDGTNLSRYRGVVYIAKEEALGNAQVTIGFDPNREKVRILTARSLSPDGKVYNLSPDQIKISKGSSGSVYFNQYKQISFTIPKVSVGSLVDYSYESEEFNPFDKQLYQGRFYFQGSAPVVDTILRVSVPHGQKLYYTAPNCTKNVAKPKMIDAVDSDIYTWEMHNVGPIIPEPKMPPYRDIAPGIVYSLHKDFTYMNNKLRPMVKKRFQLTDLVKKKVEELTKGCKTISEKIAKLYLFCQKEIRYISIKGNLASNQVGHPAEETLKNKYGDCTDKGMLLATMLKAIGVEAYPVGILTNDAGTSIRDIAVFDDNHCITEVHMDGRIFYLDSTATDYRYPYFRSDDHGTNANNPMLGTINPIPLPPPEDNAVKINRKVTLLPDGTTIVDFTSTQNGSAESSYRYSARNLKPEEYVKAVKSSIAGLTGDYTLQIATHSDPLDFSGPFSAHSKYTLNKLAPKSGKYMIFSIPFYELSFPEVSLAKRKYNLVYYTSRLKTEKIVIKLPKGYKVKYLPPALRIQTPYVEFEVIYDLQDDKIEISRKLAFPRRIVPVKDYQSYKANLEKIAYSSKERIFLEEQDKSAGGEK